MNTNLASYIMGMVIDENDHFYFVQKDGQTYALDKAEGPHQVGESVKGFAYTDMKQKLRLTTLEVTATQESFGWGTVTEVRKDLGVFVDTGLPDKQIVVSLDILPEIKDLWPKKGDRLYIRLEVDKKDRIWDLSLPGRFPAFGSSSLQQYAKPKLASHCLPLEIVWDFCLSPREQYARLYSRE